MGKVTVAINGLIVDSRVWEATGTAERYAALEMLQEIPGNKRVTVGGDKGFDTAEFDSSQDCMKGRFGEQLVINPVIMKPDLANHCHKEQSSIPPRYALSLLGPSEFVFELCSPAAACAGEFRSRDGAEPQTA
jgi:hypothetical protein